ncbi:MAG: hypothetical protein IJC25_02045 [Clostridia bacterium]|nr:hypothetical protein [Clostridia bacterium]
MSKKTQKWMALDNAAKIYPAAQKKNWTALFRISATLTEPVDVAVLRIALEHTIKRFPAYAQRLQKGLFWYYLEHIDGVPPIQPDVGNPCVRMKLKENNGFMLRVRYYNNRIAVEFFHVLTDGTGGLVFTKTLVAEYLRLKYGADIPAEGDILDVGVSAPPEELEDSFLRYATPITRSRSEADSFRLRGTPETDDYSNVITGMIPVKDILAFAKQKGVTVTELLTAVMILSGDALQRRRVQRQKKLKPVKVAVPVNLRNLFPSCTTRNFANYANPGIEPRYGTYTLDEVLRIVHSQMVLEVTPKIMAAKFSTNVNSERNPVLRVMPLFIKNIALKLTFHMVGDRKTFTTISNLGVVRVPPQMEQYVERFETVIGPLSRNPVVCGVSTYRDTLYFNVVSTIQETELQREFFTRLVKLGIPVRIESNQRW